jgi:hypothetical protein
MIEFLWFGRVTAENSIKPEKADAVIFEHSTLF